MATAEALRTLVLTGRFQEALERYRRLLPGIEANRPDVRLLAATAATRLGELAVGTDLAELALVQFRARGDWDGSMRSLNLLGAISFERGQIALAESHFAEALRLARRLGDSLMLARASNNLASVAHLQGHPDKAAELYRGALLAYQRLGDRRGMAETYHNLGLSYRQAGHVLEAEDAAADAVRHAGVVGEAGLLALALSGRAELSVERNEPVLAAHELEQAARLALEAADDIGGAEVQRVQSLAAIKQGNWRLALEYAEQARTTALAHDSAQLTAESAELAARALRALGRRDEAAVRHREAVLGFRRLGATTLLEKLELD